MSNPIDQARSNIARWRDSSLTFVREVFKVEPDAWQREGLEAFSSRDPKKKRIVAKACAGPGKTAFLAWCGLNFLSCYGEKGDHPNGAAVSITYENLQNNLWKEFAKWIDRSDFLKAAFVHTTERIFAKDHPKTWFLSARSFQKRANVEDMAATLAGLHGKYILYLIDESGSIHPAIGRSAEQGLSTNPAFGKILTAGNPISLEGLLYITATQLRHLWYVITITGDPDDPRRSPRIDIEWAREQIRQYGRDNPWVMAYILGQFPPSSINTLLGIEEVEEAMRRHLQPDTYQWSQKRIGVDVARFGDDRTVLFPRQGLAAFKPVIMRHKRGDPVSVDIGNRVISAKTGWGSEVELFDDTVGWAHGAIDYMVANGYSPLGIAFNMPGTKPRFKNRRAEGWWEMAEWIKKGGALPYIPEMIAELTTPTYTYQGGQMLMEDKKQVKERLGRSPDLADALALTFMTPDMPASDPITQALMGGMRREAQQVKHDWNPFDEQRS